MRNIPLSIYDWDIPHDEVIPKHTVYRSELALDVRRITHSLIHRIQ